MVDHRSLRSPMPLVLNMTASEIAQRGRDLIPDRLFCLYFFLCVLGVRAMFMCLDMSQTLGTSTLETIALKKLLLPLFIGLVFINVTDGELFISCNVCYCNDVHCVVVCRTCKLTVWRTAVVDGVCHTEECRSTSSKRHSPIGADQR